MCAHELTARVLFPQLPTATNVVKSRKVRIDEGYFAGTQTHFNNTKGQPNFEKGSPPLSRQLFAFRQRKLARCLSKSSASSRM
jgi:hypothetical protein